MKKMIGPEKEYELEIDLHHHKKGDTIHLHIPREASVAANTETVRGIRMTILVTETGRGPATDRTEIKTMQTILVRLQLLVDPALNPHTLPSQTPLTETIVEISRPNPQSLIRLILTMQSRILYTTFC
jgi:hypothetical protein